MQEWKKSLLKYLLTDKTFCKTYNPLLLKNLAQNPNVSNQHQNLKFSFAFIILFLLYHGAEYFIMFKNNVAGFFGCQIAFFLAAFFLGNWYTNNGLKAWGLGFSVKLFKPLLTGITLGLLLYGITYAVSLLLGIEVIKSVPGFQTALLTILPLILGLFFTSFSEDLLTRGLIFAHFNTKLNTLLLVLVSAVVYVLNHIYRFTDGLETLLYLFLLGIIFIIPVVYTKNLWLTGGMHWAGNVFFYFSHNIIQTETTNHGIPPNYLFAFCIVVFIPVLWFFLKKKQVDFQNPN